MYPVYFWEGGQMVGFEEAPLPFVAGTSHPQLTLVASSAQNTLYLTVSRQAITGYSSLFLVLAI